MSWPILIILEWFWRYIDDDGSISDIFRIKYGTLESAKTLKSTQNESKQPTENTNMATFWLKLIFWTLKMSVIHSTHSITHKNTQKWTQKAWPCIIVYVEDAEYISEMFRIQNGSFKCPKMSKTT